MSQERLTHLTLLHVHGDIVEKLNIPDMMKAHLEYYQLKVRHVLKSTAAVQSTACLNANELSPLCNRASLRSGDAM